LSIWRLIKLGKVEGLGSAGERRKTDFAASVLAKDKPFGPGDSVVWKSQDEELPKGTIGKVLCLHDDGDVEVMFPTTEGLKTFTFQARRLEKVSTALSSDEVRAKFEAAARQERAKDLSKAGFTALVKVRTSAR